MQAAMNPLATATPVVEQVKVIVLPDGSMDRKNAAKALNRTTKTLAEWRRLGIGPRGYDRGGRIFYRWEDVQAFMRGEIVRSVKQ